MHRRPWTICLPLLALLIALTLIAHDAVMAAGPHDAGAHSGHHDGHDPAGDTACGELVAARTNDAGPDIDVASAPGDAVDLPLPSAGGPIVCDGGRASDAPVSNRAMLQVWLN